MELTDLAPLSRWAQLESRIGRDFGTNASVFDADGIRITNGKGCMNELCKAIKATDRGQSFICAVAHMNLASIAKRNHCPVVEECDAGMLKMVVPVFAGSAFLGAVSGCGVLPDEGVADSELISRTTGIDVGDVERLAGSVPRICSATVDAFVESTKRQIRHIVLRFEGA